MPDGNISIEAAEEAMRLKAIIKGLEDAREKMRVTYNGSTYDMAYFAKGNRGGSPGPFILAALSWLDKGYANAIDDALHRMRKLGVEPPAAAKGAK